MITNELFKNVLYYFFFLVSLFSIRSQTNRICDFGVSTLVGKNINKASDREFGKTNPVGIELDFNRNLDGSNHWEKLYNYPHIGWSLSWIDHQNEILGSSIALNRNIKLIFLRKRYFEIYIMLSQGLMYATEIYETESRFNEKFNNAISQRINFSEQLGAGININPTKNITFNLSAALKHFSNGAISQPNDGLNLLFLKLGVIYVSGDKTKFIMKKPIATEDKKNIRLNFSAAGGIKQLTAQNEEKYSLVTLGFYIDKKLAQVSALNIGTDLFINSSVKHSIDNNNSYEAIDFKRIGISAGHELLINRLGITTQIGYHIYSPYPSLSPFYQKFGLKYYITDKLFAVATLRMFKLEISDELVWGLGLRI